MPEKRILILGGAGYIGRTLLNLYVGEEAAVTLVDKRFCTETAIQMRSASARWRYVEGDIGDKPLMRRLLVDEHFDIVYLLAGEIEAETSGERERLLWEQNYDKPAAVMGMCPADTRLFFPSSANVFGGNTSQPDHIFAEDEAPRPMYPYAETKAAMEALIAEEGSNYTIARLGTNYGWGKSIRFNLVVNLFSKLAVQGRQLSVHGNGLNHRPFVHNEDCARAIKFLSEHAETQGGLYHVVQQNYTINEVADAVMEEIGGGLPAVRHIAWKRGFPSYQMSSAKLLDLGFRFKWDLNRGIRDIIDRLSAVSR